MQHKSYSYSLVFFVSYHIFSHFSFYTHRAHPHKLVGKDICSKGVCTLEINNDTMTATFANLGIQCVKKKDIDDSLKERERIRVDPFRSKKMKKKTFLSSKMNQSVLHFFIFLFTEGFNHASQPSSIDLNAVRLCFQVFLKDPEGNNFNIPLPPVVSEPIYDKKAMSDLVICKLSRPCCNVAGGEEIILLCEKVFFCMATCNFLSNLLSLKLIRESIDSDN